MHKERSFGVGWLHRLAGCLMRAELLKRGEVYSIGRVLGALADHIDAKLKQL